MSGPWFGGTRGSRGPDLAPARSAMDGAAAALLDLDTRQNYVDGAIRDGGQVEDLADLEQGWRPIAERAFAASAKYMDAFREHPMDGVGYVNVDAARRDFEEAHRAMSAAAGEVDTFYRKHRSRIDGAKRAVDAIPAELDAARRRANAATEQAAQLAARQPEVLEYRGVIAAMDRLSAALANLNAPGPLAAQRTAATEVLTAAEQFEQTLAEAPELLSRTSAAIPSVRTRIQALNTRLDRMPGELSALWREFNAASSADLAQHRQQAEAALAAAERELGQATEALAQQRAEDAADDVAAARTHAASADQRISEVSDRLRLLREMKSDPRGAEGKVRFGIRDAQRLVVDRGLTGEWGSVLDAQSARVDRAMDTVDKPHPDYWAIHRELQAVREFVADVVERVRAQAREGR